LGRPGPQGEQELADTIEWCQRAVKHSGLSDLSIELKLAAVGFRQATDTGRNFSRWKTGERKLDTDTLQQFVAALIAANLIEDFGYPNSTLERRVRPVPPIRASELLARETALRQQVETSLEQVAAELVAVAEALKASGMLTYDPAFDLERVYIFNEETLDLDEVTDFPKSARLMGPSDFLLMAEHLRRVKLAGASWQSKGKVGAKTVQHRSKTEKAGASPRKVKK
jgi:hypothetical protein